MQKHSANVASCEITGGFFMPKFWWVLVAAVICCLLAIAILESLP